MFFEFYFESDRRNAPNFSTLLLQFHFQRLTLTKLGLIALKVAFHCPAFLQLLQSLLLIQAENRTGRRKDTQG